MAEQLVVTGARGPGLTELARRTGNFGVLPTDSDAQALDKVADAAILQNPGFKGDTGDTGPANSTYTTLAALKAAAVTNASYIFAPPSGSDGGAAAGTFLYQTAGAPYTADGVNVVKLDAVPLTTGALVRQGAQGIAFGTRNVGVKLGELLTFTDFYRTGDTSASAAWMRMTDRVRQLGGAEVQVPPGDFPLSEAVTLCDNLTLRGTSRTRFLDARVTAGRNDPLIKNFEGSGFTSSSTRTASKGLRLYDFEIDGQGVGIPGALIPNDQMRGALICLGSWYDDSGMTDVEVAGLRLHDFRGAGLMLWKSTDLRIRRNRFTNFFADAALAIGSGLDLHECDTGWIDQNICRHTSSGLSWHAMVALDWDKGCSSLRMSDNDIRGMNFGDGISCEGNAGPGSNLSNSTIDGNIIFDCKGQGIGVDGCASVTVKDNDIQRVIGPGILFTGTPQVKIINNDIKSSGLGGIVSRSGTRAADIKNNRVFDIGYTDPDYRGHAIECKDDSNEPNVSYEISQNVVSDIDGCGILAYGASCRIVSNTAFNVGRNAQGGADTLRAGIMASDTAIVLDNDIHAGAGTQYGIASGSGDIPTMRNNRMHGTFGRAWYHIGFRRTGINHNLSVSIIDAAYDAATNIFTGRYDLSGGDVPGYWYKNDRMLGLGATPGAPEGRIVTATPSTWNDFGSIGA